MSAKGGAHRPKSRCSSKPKFSKTKDRKTSAKKPWSNYFYNLGPYQLKITTPKRQSGRMRSGEDSRRMRWSTSQDTYGDFFDEWGRTYLTRLPQVVKNKPVQGSQKKDQKPRLGQPYGVVTTSTDYGNFYSETREGSGKRSYAINNSFLPPMFDDPDESERYYVDRGQARFQQPEKPPRDRESASKRLKLPDIRSVDVQFLTSDYSTVTLYANQKGHADYVTFPSGVSSIKLPNIREVNVKVRKKDGTQLNFHTQPYFYRKE